MDQGNFQWESCTFGCRFKLEARNTGSGCAEAVRGIVRLYLDQAAFDSGDQLESAGWSLPDTRRINPGEAFSYVATVSQGAAEASPAIYVAEFSWDDVACG